MLTNASRVGNDHDSDCSLIRKLTLNQCLASDHNLSSAALRGIRKQTFTELFAARFYWTFKVNENDDEIIGRMGSFVTLVDLSEV